MTSKLSKEFSLIIGLTLCGCAYSLFSGLAPRPWEQRKTRLAPGEIRAVDARVLNAVWLDARRREDFEGSHIQDALWFDTNNWDAGLIALMDEWLPQPKPIIVYCASDQCDSSRQIAEYLRKSLPEAEVYSLKGGWSAWSK